MMVVEGRGGRSAFGNLCLGAGGVQFTSCWLLLGKFCRVKGKEERGTEPLYAILEKPLGALGRGLRLTGKHYDGGGKLSLSCGKWE